MTLTVRVISHGTFNLFHGQKMHISNMVDNLQNIWKQIYITNGIDETQFCAHHDNHMIVRVARATARWWHAPGSKKLGYDFMALNLRTKSSVFFFADRVDGPCEAEDQMWSIPTIVMSVNSRMPASGAIPMCPCSFVPVNSHRSSSLMYAR